ncbi:hypothetical protein A9Q99_07525 [Gammaproteobacteria bacterium 45_16_T64]|nr:hypothetical protein A9Q99_07525 [Gammaproteobacteria bacterium 45_16_T64]
MSTHLSLQDVAVRYASKTIVENINVDLAEGEIGCLLGPSGCGKTTLLRTIAGFEKLAAGKIFLRNKEVSNVARAIPPEKRRVGMVFQDYALFPHLTVAQNIAFGLSHLKKTERQDRVDQLLTLTDLSDTKTRYPHQLSGGQQQRIALARALAPKPDILLMDEPFSNLDVELREHLAHDIRQLIKSEKMTAILVTHDQQEAFATADKIALLNAGKLVQWGTANELYHQPNSSFSAEFIGQGVLIQGTIVHQESGRKSIQTEIGTVLLPNNFSATNANLLIRPDQLSIESPEDSATTPNTASVPVTLLHKSFRGGYCLCTLETEDGQRLLAQFPSHFSFDINHSFKVSINLDSTTPVAC